MGDTVSRKDQLQRLQPSLIAIREDVDRAIEASDLAHQGVWWGVADDVNMLLEAVRLVTCATESFSECASINLDDAVKAGYKPGRRFWIGRNKKRIAVYIGRAIAYGSAEHDINLALTRAFGLTGASRQKDKGRGNPVELLQNFNTLQAWCDSLRRKTDRYADSLTTKQIIFMLECMTDILGEFLPVLRSLEGSLDKQRHNISPAALAILDIALADLSYGTQGLEGAMHMIIVAKRSLIDLEDIE